MSHAIKMNFIAGVQQKQMKPRGNGLMSDKHHPEKSQGAWLSAVSDQKNKHHHTAG